MNTEQCALCGATEDQRPLITARYKQQAVHFCPGCMPALIHGLPEEVLAERLAQAPKA